VDTYAEWDTWETVNAVKDAIGEIHNVTLVEANNDAYQKLKELKPDIVFNFAEGLIGVNRESHMPAMMEMLQIPYSGSDALTLGICLDKSRAKEILTYYKIPNAKFLVANQMEDIVNANFDFPLIVKPISEGSSKGIFSSSFVKNTKELEDEVTRILFTYNQPALIEEFIEGREFNVSVVGDLKPKVLPISEIDVSKMPDHLHNIVSYQAKWDPHHESYHKTIPICPANISKDLEEKIKHTAIAAFKIMGTRDYARVDMRVTNDEEIYVLEVNPNPDLTDGAGFMRSAHAAGLSYSQALKKLVMLAYERGKRAN